MSKMLSHSPPPPAANEIDTPDVPRPTTAGEGRGRGVPPMLEPPSASTSYTVSPHKRLPRRVADWELFHAVAVDLNVLVSFRLAFIKSALCVPELCHDASGGTIGCHIAHFLG